MKDKEEIREGEREGREKGGREESGRREKRRAWPSPMRSAQVIAKDRHTHTHKFPGSFPPERDTDGV